MEHFGDRPFLRIRFLRSDYRRKLREYATALSYSPISGAINLAMKEDA